MRPATALLGLAIVAAACGGASDDSTADVPTALSVRGTWALSHTELANDCSHEGDLFPVAPGLVVIEQDTHNVTLSSGDELPRVYLTDAEGWFRQRHAAFEGCSAFLTERWILHGISQSRLSATFEARIETRGACEELEVSTCSVRHSVWGVRR